MFRVTNSDRLPPLGLAFALILGLLAVWICFQGGEDFLAQALAAGFLLYNMMRRHGHGKPCASAAAPAL